MTVGILGMAFKAESDDIRVSLSATSCKRLLRSGRARAVHRPVRHATTDLVAPRRGARASPTSWSSRRRTRRTADLDTDVPVVDIWNLLGDGVRV